MRLLKRDGLGEVSVLQTDHGEVVVRDTRAAHRWARWLARRLARREALALEALHAVAGVPQLLDFDGVVLRRSYLPGLPMHAARPADALFFRSALRLVRVLHAAGIAHNDLAKEPNWIRTAAGEAALIDFQLAHISPRRGRLFRLLAREDLRHLMKHKRCYLPAALTARQRALLAAPSLPALAWRALAKPPYRFFTRRLLGWREREGPSERVW